jgi:hypothetical protein
MPRHFSTAHWFLLGGGVLALLGLILWAALPIKSSLPPYFLTPLLALGYGLFCLITNGPTETRKRTGKRA